MSFDFLNWFARKKKATPVDDRRELSQPVRPNPYGRRKSDHQTDIVTKYDNGLDNTPIVYEANGGQP